MLTGGALYARTADSKAFELSLVEADALFFLIFFYKAYCGFLGNGRYCACLKNVAFAEQLLGVAVRF